MQSLDLMYVMKLFSMTNVWSTVYYFDTTEKKLRREKLCNVLKVMQ